MGRNVGAWQLIILCVSGGGQREAAAGGGLLVGAILRGKEEENPRIIPSTGARTWTSPWSWTTKAGSASYPWRRPPERPWPDNRLG